MADWARGERGRVEAVAAGPAVIDAAASKSPAGWVVSAGRPCLRAEPGPGRPGFSRRRPAAPRGVAGALRVFPPILTAQLRGPEGHGPHPSTRSGGRPPGVEAAWWEGVSRRRGDWGPGRSAGPRGTPLDADAGFAELFGR